ncbi:MAG: sulfite exporter TauE/SafE family protein [Acidimicrobiia bacterium]
MNLRGLLASPLGFLIGLVMGALGGGGAVLAVPALVYVAGQTPKNATASALLIVMCTAIGGLLAHSRDGNVQWGVGLAFGSGGVVGALLGSALNTLVDDDVLLLAFSGLLLVVSASMFRQARDPRFDREPGVVDDGDPVPHALAGRPGKVAEVAALGIGVGVVTGFFGVGGGFIIVPVLMVVLKFPVHQAVGTSLLVISINSLVSLIARQAWGSIEWSVALPFTVAALLGVVTGNWLAKRVRSRVLIRAFAQLLIVIALYTALDTALSM